MESIKYDFSIIFKEIEDYNKNNPKIVLQSCNQANVNIDLDEIKKFSQMCSDMNEQEVRGVIYNTFS